MSTKTIKYLLRQRALCIGRSTIGMINTNNHIMNLITTIHNDPLIRQCKYKFNIIEPSPGRLKLVD